MLTAEVSCTTGAKPGTAFPPGHFLSGCATTGLQERWQCLHYRLNQPQLPFNPRNRLECVFVSCILSLSSFDPPEDCWSGLNLPSETSHSYMPCLIVTADFSSFFELQRSQLLHPSYCTGLYYQFPFKKKDWFLFYLYLYVCTGGLRPEEGVRSAQLESRAIVSFPKQVLGTELNSSAKAASF